MKSSKCVHMSYVVYPHNICVCVCVWLFNVTCTWGSHLYTCVSNLWTLSFWDVMDVLQLTCLELSTNDLAGDVVVADHHLWTCGRWKFHPWFCFKVRFGEIPHLSMPRRIMLDSRLVAWNHSTDEYSAELMNFGKQKFSLAKLLSC